MSHKIIFERDGAKFREFRLCEHSVNIDALWCSKCNPEQFAPPPPHSIYFCMRCGGDYKHFACDPVRQKAWMRANPESFPQCETCGEWPTHYGRDCYHQAALKFEALVNKISAHMPDEYPVGFARSMALDQMKERS